MEQRKGISRKRKLRLFARQNYLCQCGRPAAHIDHITPLWCGGTNDDDNLQALCVDCHKTKTASEAGRRAKADRLRRGRKPPKRKIASRGFDNAKRPIYSSRDLQKRTPDEP